MFPGGGHDTCSAAPLRWRVPPKAPLEAPMVTLLRSAAHPRSPPPLGTTPLNSLKPARVRAKSEPALPFVGCVASVCSPMKWDNKNTHLPPPLSLECGQDLGSSDSLQMEISKFSVTPVPGLSCEMPSDPLTSLDVGFS